MKEIIFLDRVTKKRVQEKVYGQAFLSLLYGGRFRFLLSWISQNPFFSRFYGFLCYMIIKNSVF